MTEPFAVFDCSLACLPIGRSCSNLRELLEAIRVVPDMVIEHHMMRCVLEDHFDLYEFPNDLARWCWDMLGDHMLAEQLGLIDPYQHESIDSLRAELVNVIEERLWEIDRVPSCPPGLGAAPGRIAAGRLRHGRTLFHAHCVGRGDTRASRCGLCSITCTLLDGARPGHSDDFSNWLESYGADAGLVARLRKIDAHFLNLNQLRDQVIDAFRECLPVPQPLLKASRLANEQGRTMKLLDRYEEIVGHQEVERLRRLAARLAGQRLVHVNSTRIGGGVAEILGWMVPLMEELGIDAHWEVIAGPPDFYRVTKAFHNGMQGLPVVAASRATSTCTTRSIARTPNGLNLAGGHRLRPRSAADLSSRLHAARPGGSGGSGAATSTPRSPIASSGSTWNGRSPRYDAAIFSMAAFARPLPCPMFLIPALDRSACPTRTARFPRPNGWRP